MNVKQIKRLKSQRLREIVAELLGAEWRCIYCASHASLTFDFKNSSPPEWGWCRKDNNRPFADDIPDYLNDLDAMHKAEKVLNEHQRYLFCKAIAWSKYKLDDLWLCTHATAKQRAVGFVFAMTEWMNE